MSPGGYSVHDIRRSGRAISHIFRSSCRCLATPMKKYKCPFNEREKPYSESSFECQQVRSQLQLKPRLEKLSSAGEVESIQRPIPIGHLEPDVVGKMPVGHWRNSPELPASQRLAIKVNVGKSRHELPGSRPSLENWTSRRNPVEITATRVVRANLARSQPRNEHIATVKEGISRRRRVDLLKEIL